MKGLGALMKQAQQMQENMQKAQEELAALEVTGESGGGMVKVVMSCKHAVRRIDIEDSLLDEPESTVAVMPLRVSDSCFCFRF